MDTVHMTLGLTNAELVAAFGSLFLPLLIAFVQQQEWTDRIRMFVAYIVDFVYTLAAMYLVGDLVFDEHITAKLLIRAFFIVAIVSYTSFKTFWQPNGSTARIEAKV